MNPAHRLGVALRRLGTVVAIAHLRREHDRRLECHGGEVDQLNEKLAARADEVAATVAEAERRFLG